METKHKMKLKINFGTMIEVVRAALTANELAKLLQNSLVLEQMI